MITTALLILSIVVFYVGRLLTKQNETIIELLKESKEKPKLEYKSAPNLISKKPTDDISFEENNPLSIPRNVKFQVEGGDSLLPFGFDEPSPNKIMEA